MFDPLNKYPLNGHFFFNSTDLLSETCNAPTNKGGVFIVNALKHGRIELVYIIGSSGKKLANGDMDAITTGLGGLKETLVNGNQLAQTPRKKSWPIQMLSEDIDALDIYWWVTHDKRIKDCPTAVEALILNIYYEWNGKLPRWNKALTKMK